MHFNPDLKLILGSDVSNYGIGAVLSHEMPGITNWNADASSRLPLAEMPDVTPIPGDTMKHMEHLEEISLHSTQIRDWTCRHPVLSKVCQFVLGSWSSTCFSKELQPYFSQRTGISAEDGCLLWGTKVSVPSKGKSKVLAVSQEVHLGITRTKSLAHSYVWWPGLDHVIETQVKNCEKCQQNQKQPTEAPLHPWDARSAIVTPTCL